MLHPLSHVLSVRAAIPAAITNNTEANKSKQPDKTKAIRPAHAQNAFGCPHNKILAHTHTHTDIRIRLQFLSINIKILWVLQFYDKDDDNDKGTSGSLSASAFALTLKSN